MDPAGGFRHLNGAGEGRAVRNRAGHLVAGEEPRHDDPDDDARVHLLEDLGDHCDHPVPTDLAPAQGHAGIHHGADDRGDLTSHDRPDTHAHDGHEDPDHRTDDRADHRGDHLADDGRDDETNVYFADFFDDAADDDGDDLADDLSDHDQDPDARADPDR